MSQLIVFFSIVLSILMLCSCSSKYGFISVVFLWVVYMTKIRLAFCNSVTEAIEDIFLCEKHKMRSVFFFVAILLFCDDIYGTWFSLNNLAQIDCLLT